MAPEKSKLDALRIEREAPARSSGWVVLAVVLVVVVAAVVAWWLIRPRPQLVRVATVVEVQLGTESTVLNASGYVTARTRATVSSKVTAKVIEVLIEEGMEVAEGQVLARLDDSNVRVSLRLAEAGLAAARSAMAETEVRIREAQLNLDRVVSLVGKGVASEAELDRARAEVDSLGARRDAQRDEVAVAEREVEVWRQQLDDTVIRAPFAGVVVSKDAQPGEMISPISAGGGYTRTGIGTLVDMSSLEIEVDVNESYINRVRSGQSVVATLDAYPTWQIPARVIAIVPTADRQKATVRVRIAIEATDPRILPDMGVKVAFQEAAAEQRQLAVVVPNGALTSDAGATVVFVLDGDRVERRAVRAAGAVEAGRVIESGLAPGERVVIDAPRQLIDQERVEVAR